LNGFENKAKYGAGYGYGYGYGYGSGYSNKSYSNGYHDDDKPKTIFEKIRAKFRKNKFKNKTGLER
jgi:hypothetical protein